MSFEAFKNMSLMNIIIMFVLQNRLKESLELFRSIWNNRFVWICFSFFRGIQVRSKSLHIIPVKLRYNKPKRSPWYNGRYFFAPVMVKYTKKNCDITKPRYGEQILTVPWPFIIIYRGSAVRIFNSSFFSGQHFSLQGNKGQLATPRKK